MYIVIMIVAYGDNFETAYMFEPHLIKSTFDKQDALDCVGFQLAALGPDTRDSTRFEIVTVGNSERQSAYCRSCGEYSGRAL